MYGGFHVWAVKGMAWAWVPVELLLSATNEPGRECGLTMMMMIITIMSVQHEPDKCAGENIGKNSSRR